MDSKNEGAHDDASHYFCEEAHEVVVRTASVCSHPPTKHLPSALVPEANLQSGPLLLNVRVAR